MHEENVKGRNYSCYENKKNKVEEKFGDVDLFGNGMYCKNNMERISMKELIMSAVLQKKRYKIKL